MTTTPKDTFSLNETESLNRLLQDSNEFLIDLEGDELEITTFAVTVRDKRGVLVGSFTKWSKSEDVKFEPNYDVGDLGA